MSAVLAAIAPVFLVAGCAYILRRSLPIHDRTLSTLNLYLFIPALVFGTLSKSAINWILLGRVAGACIVMLVISTAILEGIVHVLRLEGPKRHAWLLTQFPNLGNFGLPVVLFAFGEGGLKIALVVLVCGSFMQNSVGVYFAQRSRHGAGKAFLRVLGFPMLYAFALALIVQHFHFPVPTVIARAVDITADAAVPIQIIMLGSKLAETRLERGRDVFLAATFRLCGGPLIACGAAWLVGLSELDAKVFILQMSSPVAVGIAVYGVQFELAPAFLASVVSWSFLFSAITVTIVLSILTGVWF